MSYINTSRKSRLTINGVDESARMISWSANDDSLFKNGIMRTSGQVVLGTTALTQYDYQREAYKRGQTVQMELWNETSQQWELHPRGLLYVLSTAFSAEAQQVTLDIGCKLAVWTMSDNIDEVYEYSVVELNEGQRTIQNISQGLYSSNKLIYQDNTGTIQTRDIFDLSSATDPATVPSTWSTGSKTEALSAAPLDGSEIPDIIDLDYNYIGSEIFTDQQKVSTDTSTYDISFNAGTWARTGSGPELNSVSTIDASYSGQPGAAVGQYEEIVDSIKVSSSRTETTTEYFNGPGGQLTRSIQEVYTPGTEVKAEYFEDQYSACRYTAALDGDADATSCSYLQATSPMLASRIITSLTYDDAGTVTSRRVETWKPVLAAAQSFNWKSGDGDDGQPENFQAISLTDLYRDTIVITDYSQNDDGDNVETITTYRSGAVEYNAGIYATTGVIGTAELTVSEPSAYPDVQGLTSLGLATDTVTGTGTGMTVNVAWPSNTGGITELTVTSTLSDCQWGIGPANLPASGYYPLAASSDSGEVLQSKYASAVMYWGALPDTGPRLSGAWSGGSGSGFDGYIPTSSLPSISSNISGFRNSPPYAGQWDVYVTSTDFVGAATDIIEITERGSGYQLGDIVTWTNNVTAAQQYGSQYASLGQALVTNYGQSLSTTTITAQVTGVNLIKPLITIVDNGSGYQVGDQVRVTAATLTSDLGQTITQDLVFTITSGEAGVTNLGEGIASLSQTDWVAPSGGGGATDQYAATSGTVKWDFRYTQSETYPTTLTSTGGSNGTTGRFSAYDPDGIGIVDTPQITPLSVRNNSGLLVIDNGYMRSPGITTTDILVGYNPGKEWCWESWIYVDTMSQKGISLCHFAGPSYPTTAGNGLFTGTSLRYVNGYYMKGGNIEAHTLTYDNQGSANEIRITSSDYSASTAYPTGRWFHLAIAQDNFRQQTDPWDGRFYAYGRVRIFIDGVLTAQQNPFLGNQGAGTNLISTCYCYTGAGGFDSSVTFPVAADATKVALEPTSDADFSRIAFSQTRFITGSPVYSANFTPIDKDPSINVGNFNAGIYEGIELVPTSGIGKAATANLEVVLGGGGGAGGTGWDPVFVTPALAYLEDIGTADPTGGSGNGIRVTLGVGYSGETYSGSSPIVVRNVVDPGAGYSNGDQLTIAAADIQSLLSNYGGGSVSGDLVFSVTPSDAGTEAGAWLFPDVVGTQFAVGDTVKVTRTAVQAAGAGDPEQDISATVTAITPERPVQNLTLDALDGGKRIVVNTSSTDSTLPNNPDTNATPSLPTLETKLLSPIRIDAYEATFGGKADSVEETLQVPNTFSSAQDVAEFAQDYTTYLKNYIIGEGYGLRIGEAMRDEIMTSWTPMAGLRYTDERIDETFAMRADAASWGVSADEAAVVYNGIWLGEVAYLSFTDTVDGGNFTSDVTLAVDSDRYDGGNFTTGTATTDNTDTPNGGNFTTGEGGVVGSEDYLDVGKVCSMQIGLEFDATTTFTLDLTGTTALPIQVDWEGTALTEEVVASGATHSYDEGDYLLGIYHESSDSTTTLSPYFNASASADKVTSVSVLSEALMPASLLSAFEGCSSMVSFVVSADAAFSNTDIFDRAWLGCTTLPNFPSLPAYKTSAASFTDAWNGCSSLKGFSAGFFDSITSWNAADAMTGAFNGCALSAESIQNILVSLDTVTAPFLANVLDIDGGTNASYSTWSTTAVAALTSLQGKGWTVNYNP